MFSKYIFLIQVITIFSINCMPYNEFSLNFTGFIVYTMKLNVLIQDNEKYTCPINQVYTRNSLLHLKFSVLVFTFKNKRSNIFTYFWFETDAMKT